MTDIIKITVNRFSDIYKQVSKALWDAISEFQQTGEGLQTIELDGRRITITALPDDDDNESVKVRLFCMQTDTMRSMYLYLRNPDDDTEEITTMVIGMAQE